MIEINMIAFNIAASTLTPHLAHQHYRRLAETEHRSKID